MAGDFFPRTEAKIPAWSANLRDKIVAAAQSYGLSQQIADEYSSLHDLFMDAYLRAADPATRTRGAVSSRNDARRRLESAARSICGIVKACPEVSTAQYVSLGLNPRKRGGRNPRIGKPDSAPVVVVESVKDRTVHLRLLAAGNSTRRGRPVGVKSAAIFYFLGEEPAATLREWRFLFATVKTRVAVNLGADVPAGAKVFFAAVWANPTGQRGPVSAAAGTHIGGGVTMPGSIRLAA
jgi:hypothetical protein